MSNINIKQIAKIAGVSVATVSKVFNNYPDVSDKTRKKIMKLIEEQKYRPNAIGRSLSSNRSYSIGLFHDVQSIRHPFFKEIIFGLEQELSNKGYDIVLLSKTHNKFTYLEQCKYRNVDGAILLGPPKTDNKINELINSEIPAVFIDSDVVGEKTSYVISNNYEGAKLAIEYLYKLGHRKIGSLMGILSTKPAQDRLSGHLQAFNELNIKYKQQWFFESGYKEQDGYTSMKKILEMKNLPTAFFCHSDRIVIGAIQAVKEGGYNVPDDFSFIGFDDIEVCEYINPKITTIAQNKVQIGKEAADLLLKIINNSNEGKLPVILPVKLVERDSVAKIYN